MVDIRQRQNIWFPKQVNYMEIDEHDPVTIDYWKREKKRCKKGFTLGNVYVPGWVYWHTTYWQGEADSKDKMGRTFKKRQFLSFRDIEWIIGEALMRAEKEKKGFVLCGSRGFAKTTIAASLCGYYATFFADTEVVVSCGNSGDNKKVTDFTEVGLQELVGTPFERKRSADDWKKEVAFGYKDTKGNREGLNSRITIRNFNDGSNTMACNGCRPKFHIIDEIGKILNLQACYDDSIECWKDTDGNQFSIVMLAGTGGDMEVGADAAKIFFDPRPNNLLEFPDRWEGRINPIGLFIPCTMAKNAYKFPQKLTDYLGLPSNPGTDHINILVSDEDKCFREWYLPNLEEKRKGGSSSLIKFKAYNPIKPSESFYVINENPFPTEELQSHLTFLKEKEIKGRVVELFRDPQTSKVQHKIVTDNSRMPIDEYPISSDATNIRGAVVIYEFPTDTAEMLYVASCDPYSQAKAVNSTSIGSMYIFKRVGDIAGDQYYDMMVAHYAGRPETQVEFYETCELLMELYNARCMPENETSNFIDYFDRKNKMHWLADGLSLTKEITPGTTVDRAKGLPATIGIINHCMNHLLEYLKEEIVIGYDYESKRPIRRRGLTRILDPMLIEEMLKYRKEAGNKRKTNCDRIVSFRIALAYARYLDKIAPIVKVNNETPEEAERRKYAEKMQVKVHSPFVTHKRVAHVNPYDTAEPALPKIRSPFVLK